ncbi:MAG: hypothetical protein ACLTE2_11400 [Eubacteriales bacterium]
MEEFGETVLQVDTIKTLDEPMRGFEQWHSAYLAILSVIYLKCKRHQTNKRLHTCRRTTNKVTKTARKTADKNEKQQIRKRKKQINPATKRIHQGGMNMLQNRSSCQITLLANGQGSRLGVLTKAPNQRFI